MSHVNVTTFTIVVVLFLVVTGVGFAAVRWRRTEDMRHLNEWGLGAAASARLSAGSCSAETCTPRTPISPYLP